MSYNLVDPTTGDLTRVAGRGCAEYGASAVRSGTYIPSSPVQTQNDLSFSVTFDTPMPDSDYQVIFGSSSNTASSGAIQCAVRSRTPTGFTGVVRNVGNDPISVVSGTFTWFAFKLYSDVEYSNIVNSVPADASASNKLVTENKVESKYIEENILTSTDWNTLNTKARYYFSGGTPMTNSPEETPFGLLEVINVGLYCCIQRYFAFNGKLYIRRWSGDSWNEWYRFDGIAI